MSTIEEAREQARETLIATRKLVHEVLEQSRTLPLDVQSAQVMLVLLDAGYAKGPRPITDEMVEAAAREYHERGNGEGSFARMSGHVRTSLLFRMKCALRAAEEARR